MLKNEWGLNQLPTEQCTLIEWTSHSRDPMAHTDGVLNNTTTLIFATGENALAGSEARCDEWTSLQLTHFVWFAEYLLQTMTLLKKAYTLPGRGPLPL